LPSGREIVLFFYDGPLAQAVAFEDLLRDGRRFAETLAGSLGDSPDEPRLAHIATDGETYGHHHRHGEMALAYALHHLQQADGVCLTNYGAFLDHRPPRHEVRIVENSSWSCAHGVERWRSDCGCHTGGGPGWSQAWRGPLRGALDWLRDSLAPHFEEAAGALVHDPWAARQDYIDVVLDRSPASVRAFIKRQARRPLDPSQRTRLLELLELQRHAMLMYTSCGWFFNDIGGIETVQVLRYAGRAVQLAEDLFDVSLESELLERLAVARSNDPSLGDGRRIWESRVRPARVNLLNVAAHHAVSSLFEGHETRGRVYCYAVDVQDQRRRTAGNASLSVGRATVTSRITHETDTVGYAVLHFGDHSLNGGIRRLGGTEEYEVLVRDLTDAFDAGDLPRVGALLANFPEYSFSLRSLFADRQREILNRLLDARVARAEREFRAVYRDNADLMRYLLDLELPLPRAFVLAAEFVLDRELRRALDADALDLRTARSVVAEARSAGVPLDDEGLGFVVARTLRRLVKRVRARPAQIASLEQIAELVALARSAAFDVDLWTAQNLFYAAVSDELPEHRRRAAAGDEDAARWLSLFRTVGDQLGVAVP
jgi:hypothetical protein